MQARLHFTPNDRPKKTYILVHSLRLIMNEEE